MALKMYSNLILNIHKCVFRFLCIEQSAHELCKHIQLKAFKNLIGNPVWLGLVVGQLDTYN